MEGQLVADVARSLGTASATFVVMWLWLNSVRNDNERLRGELRVAQGEVRDVRKSEIETLNKVLPLITSVTEVVDANKRDQQRTERDRTAELLARLEKHVGRLGD